MAKERIVRAAVSPASDKRAAFAALQANLDKKMGAGTLVRMGDRAIVKVAVIPTGIYQLDRGPLGAGGVPKGRIIEVFGPESSGKTTICLQIIAEAQQRGGLAGFVDAEHALDPIWAGKLGVNVEDLALSQPDNGEQALEIVEEMVRSGAFDVIVVDSVAALVPRAELEGQMGDSHVGLQARLMSQAMRKLTGIVSQSKTIVIFINQIREKIGVMFGNPETTTGGRALKFYSSVRLDVRKIGVIKEGEKPVGNRVKFKAVKNKIAPPFQECEVDLLYASGFDKVGSYVDAGVANGAIDKAGAWYSFQGARLGQGRNGVIASLTDDVDTFEVVKAAVEAADKPAEKKAEPAS